MPDARTREVMERVVVEDLKRPVGDLSEVLIEAECNTLDADERRKVYDQSVNKIIEATLPMFQDLELQVPTFVIGVDGMPKRFEKASILEGYEYWAAQMDAAALASEEFQRKADEERARRDWCAANLEQHKRAIDACLARGIDPSTVMYAARSSTE